MDNLTIGQIGGTAALTAAGAGIGLKVGTKKAQELIANNLRLTGLNKDQFVVSKVEKQLGNIAASGRTCGERQEIVANIRKAAGQKFDQLAKAPEAIIKQAKKSKIKWIAGLAAAGLAIGATASFAVSKVLKQKAETANSEA